MSAQVSYFKLGLFVVVSGMLLCTGIIVLGAGKFLERKIMVETYMMQSVEGIAKGSAVKYRGIQLGQVSGVSIAARKYDPRHMKEGRMGSAVLVELAVRQKAIADIDEDELKEWLSKATEAGLRARSAASGLTGPAYIELVFLDPQQFPPPSIGWTPPDLYIPSAPSTTQVLLEAIQGVLREFQNIDMQGIASDFGELLKATTTKLDELDVNGVNTGVQGLIDDLRAKIDAFESSQISDDALAFLQEIRQSNDRLREILNNPAIDPGLSDLRTTLQNAREASGKLSEILDDPRINAILSDLDEAGAEVKPALDDFRRAVRRIDLLIASQQASIDNVLTELDRALANISELTEDATANPSRILFGEPPPRDPPRN